MGDKINADKIKAENIDLSDTHLVIDKKKLEEQITKMCTWTDDQPWSTVIQAYRAGIRDLVSFLNSEGAN